MTFPVCSQDLSTCEAVVDSGFFFAGSTPEGFPDMPLEPIGPFKLSRE